MNECCDITIEDTKPGIETGISTRLWQYSSHMEAKCSGACLLY